MIYKRSVISIPVLNNETNEEHVRRSWFVAKNVHLVNKGELDMNTLIGYSKVHLKIEIYGHKFNEEIMKTYEILKANLFV